MLDYQQMIEKTGSNSYISDIILLHTLQSNGIPIFTIQKLMNHKKIEQL